MGIPYDQESTFDDFLRKTLTATVSRVLYRQEEQNTGL